MYFSRGRVATQAHVSLPAGTVEEEYARNGFFGRTAHLYRSLPPVNWTDIDGPLKPRLYDCTRMPPAGGDYLAQRRTLLHNAQVSIGFATLTAPMPYLVRNADGDETLFVHEGSGRIDTDFGPLQYEKGDYLVIPRGTVYRLLPEMPTALLTIETAAEIRIPDRGILGQHALFDPAVMCVPEPTGPIDDGRNEWQLCVKRLGEYTRITYPFHPINTVGWKGDLCVWQLNVRDIRPVTSERYHLPPTAHATFVADGAVICTFLPRPLEVGDPEALKIPFYHANIDYDEVLFYHDGEFFSRDGIKPGMMTFHPQGIHHGPQPKAVAGAKDKTRTEEYAVMIDTRLPLQPATEAAAYEDPDYWRSWQAAPVAAPRSAR